MNNREKFLVIILAAVIVLLGGFKFLIEPQIESLAETKSALTEAISAKKQAENNVEKAETTDADNKALEAKAESSAESFFPELENDNVQIFFQQLADNTGVLYTSFVMDDKTATQISSTSNKNTDITYPAKEAADGIRNIENGESDSSAASSSNTTDKQTNDLVEMMAVTMKFNGTYEQGLKFIDEIKNSGRTVRTSSIDTSSADNGQIAWEISAECFGVVKISDTDKLSQDTLSSVTGKVNPFQ